MSENTIAGAAEDRAPIERWEGEGGRTLALEESLSARSSDLPHSDPKDGISLDARSRARTARERASSSS
jgi:hypothetical protein